MPRVKYTAEQAVIKIREYDVLISQGRTQAEACKQMCISKDTIIRWKKEFDGMEINQVKKLKELEKENAQLKKLVADLILDNSILKEVSRGNY
jgi:transposase